MRKEFPGVGWGGGGGHENYSKKQRLGKNPEDT